MKPEQITAALKAYPAARDYLSAAARMAEAKANPITRADIERIMAAIIGRIDRAYLRILENDGTNVPNDFWLNYESDLRREISKPLRKYIEQSFTNYSDYVAFIDQTGALGDIDTLMTQEISRVARGIADNTRRNLDALLLEGIADEEIIERIAMRFGGGHAEQIAITETTRAEGQFSEALQSRLREQGVTSVIRWQTSEDERVCPICGPADHRLKDDKIETSKGGWNGQTWGQRFGSPPAHPNCRCQTVVELKR